MVNRETSALPYDGTVAEGVTVLRGPASASLTAAAVYVAVAEEDAVAEAGAGLSPAPEGVPAET